MSKLGSPIPTSINNSKVSNEPSFNIDLQDRIQVHFFVNYLISDPENTTTVFARLDAAPRIVAAL